MGAMILCAIGLFLIIEGLVYVLAPSLVEQMLAALSAMSLENRRLFGLLVVLLGVCLLIAARALGAF